MKASSHNARGGGTADLLNNIDILRQVIDCATFGMALLGGDGRCLFANQAFCKLTGYNAEECIGLSLADLVHPGEHPGASVKSGGEATEHRFRRKDGSTFVGLSNTAALDATAAPFHSLLQIADIDAQSCREAALEERIWVWNQSLQGAEQSAWDYDFSTGKGWNSPQWQSILRLETDESVANAERWLERTHPDDRERLMEAMEALTSGRSAGFDQTYRMLRGDGQWIWILTRGRVVETAADGTPIRIVGTSTDISREKEKDERLIALSERLEVALEAGGIGIFAVEYPSGRRLWDARTHELHGVTPETYDGSWQAFDKLLHPDDAARIRNLRESAFGTASHSTSSYRVLLPSGAYRHLHVSVRLVRDRDGSLRRAIGACWDITDDVERNKQLHESLALLDAVMTSTPDLIFAKDLEGRYLLVNKAYSDALKLPASEIIGKTPAEIHSPDLALKIQDDDLDVLASGEPKMFEESGIMGGMPRTYAATKAPRRSESGEITGLIGISRDITDVKAAEAALRRSEMRWQFAIDGSGDGIWDWNLQSGHVFYSRRWKEMLGYDEGDIGTTVNEWSDRVHPEDMPATDALIGAHLRGETQDFAIEYRMRCKDGSWRWIHDRGKVLERGEDGQPLRVIGTHTDITARKEVEGAILALNQRLQIAIEASGAGIFELDFATNHYSWDERMHALYGIKPRDYDGTLKRWLEFILPEDVPEVMRKYEAAVHTTFVFSMNFRIKQQSSGEVRHIRSLARVTRDEAGTPLRAVGMNWDITEHMELAEALFEEKERLRITLHSIGDSVISTDAQARITFMNPVAEAMTGWSAAEAVGRRLPEVFSIVDEETGATIRDPVESCLERLQPFYLNEGAVLLSRDGERRSIRDSAAPVRTASGDVIGAVLVFQDVTKSRVLQQALEHSANHDSLTGLPNRSAFERVLRQASELARLENREHVLGFIDLDRFKIVNDGAGHAAGDALLRDVGSLLRRCCRSNDFAARLGGDEFALLLHDCSIEEGRRISQRLLRAFSDLGFVWDDRPYQIGASVGLTPITAISAMPDELMSQADIACYTAKTAGRNRVSVYGDPDDDAYRNHREMQVAAGIRNAIEANRFRLYAQEVRALSARADETRHYEILLRMLDDNGNIVEPAAFIPATERYDLMGNIDRWVIRTAFRTYGPRLRAATDLTVAINLSANSLNDPFLWPFLQEEFDVSALSPRQVHFEITETAVINNLSAAKQFLARARGAGCGVVLDDFGTGLSSFTYLRQFQVDGLKIDGGFVRQMAHNDVDRAIVESINAIGQRLGAFTVAEQVEDLATLEMARQMGIDRAQGFAICRPQPLENFL